MKLIGLTGGLGMGKSTTAHLLRQMEFEVVDTDLIAHQLVRPGQPALEEIRAVFGAEYIDARQGLRRQALAQRIFKDAVARRKLEAILHPRIREAWAATVAAWRDQGRPAGAVVIPLLFEVEAAMAFDATLCAACSKEAQRERLRRRSWSPEEIECRIAAQWPIERKMELADFVVWTEPDLRIVELQLNYVLASLV